MENVTYELVSCSFSRGIVSEVLRNECETEQKRIYIAERLSDNYSFLQHGCHLRKDNRISSLHIWMHGRYWHIVIYSGRQGRCWSSQRLLFFLLLSPWRQGRYRCSQWLLFFLLLLPLQFVLFRINRLRYWTSSIEQFIRFHPKRTSFPHFLYPFSRSPPSTILLLTLFYNLYLRLFVQGKLWVSLRKVLCN